MTGAKLSLEGRAWVFGDDIDTDAIAPGLYMRQPIEELARHCLESVDPEFAASVSPGDIVVAGHHFGLGSSREQAVMALRQLGVGAIIAKSFARIFYRNAMNLALPVLVCADADKIEAGQHLRVDAAAGAVENVSAGETYACEAIPPHLLEMIDSGGLLKHLAQKTSNRTAGSAK